MVFICHGGPNGDAMLIETLKNAEAENVKEDSVDPERRFVLPERRGVLPERAAVLPERGELDHFALPILDDADALLKWLFLF